MITYTQLSNQETYLTIHADGKITVSDKLNPDETAARVLECMKTQFLADPQATKIRELQDRIKRLEEAGDGLSMWVCPEYKSDPANIALQNWRKAKEAKL